MPGATAEALASTSHLLALTLQDGHFWHPDIVRRGTAPNQALLASLSTAEFQRFDGDGDEDDVEEAHGWNYAVREEGVLTERSLRVRLAHNATVVDSAQRKQEDCTPPQGCTTLLLHISQLVRYSTNNDERLIFTLAGATVWDGILPTPPSGALPTGGKKQPHSKERFPHGSAEGHVAAEAPDSSATSTTATDHSSSSSSSGGPLFGGGAASIRVYPPLLLRAVYPCISRTDCTTCTSRSACGWCASDAICRPRRDSGLLPGECSGLLVETCPRVEQPRPDPADGTTSNASVAGSAEGGVARDIASPPPPSVSAEGTARWIRRVGVGMLVLSVSDVDLKAGKFYADVQVYLHVETDASGADRLYPHSALLDKDKAECSSMPHWRPFEPPATSADHGLFLVNIDRYRQIFPVFRGIEHSAPVSHFRVQGAFYFRTNITSWPMNTESLDIVLETREEAGGGADGGNEGGRGASSSSSSGSASGGTAAQHQQPASPIFFCTMPEYSGLSNSIRFPGSIDNQRLSYAAKVEEHCSPPFLKPTRTCAAEPETSSSTGVPQTSPAHAAHGLMSRARSYMDEVCECELVADYVEGFDRESCGCQGGRTTSARLTFSILYRTPEIGAFTSTFMAPLTIMVANLFSYIMPPAAIETRFGLSTSSLVSLVLFHAGLKAQTPLAGVLTLADRIMIGAYASVLVSILFSSLIIVLHMTTNDNDEPHPRARIAARVIFENTRLLMPLLSVLIFFGAFIAHFPMPVLIAATAAVLCGCCLFTCARYWLARFLREKGGIATTPARDGARAGGRFGAVRCSSSPPLSRSRVLGVDADDEAVEEQTPLSPRAHAEPFGRLEEDDDEEEDLPLLPATLVPPPTSLTVMPTVSMPAAPPPARGP